MVGCGWRALKAKASQLCQNTVALAGSAMPDVLQASCGAKYDVMLEVCLGAIDAFAAMTYGDRDGSANVQCWLL